MSDLTTPTEADLARDLRADLARATDNYGPNWGRTSAAAQLAYGEFAEESLPAALRRAIAAEAERDRLAALNEKLLDAAAEKGFHISEDGRECFIDGCGEMDLVSLKELRAERDRLREENAALAQKVEHRDRHIRELRQDVRDLMNRLADAEG